MGGTCLTCGAELPEQVEPVCEACGAGVFAEAEVSPAATAAAIARRQRIARLYQVRHAKGW